jgi:hypothetical protein
MRSPLRLHPHTRWIYHVARITQHTYMSAEQSPWPRIISSTTRRCMNHRIISEAPFHVTKNFGMLLDRERRRPRIHALVEEVCISRRAAAARDRIDGML